MVSSATVGTKICHSSVFNIPTALLYRVLSKPEQSAYSPSHLIAMQQVMIVQGDPRFHQDMPAFKTTSF